jgi:hypothetical protein
MKRQPAPLFQTRDRTETVIITTDKKEPNKSVAYVIYNDESISAQDAFKAAVPDQQQRDAILHTVRRK